jgi:hypothetical protein
MCAHRFRYMSRIYFIYGLPEFLAGRLVLLLASPDLSVNVLPPPFCIPVWQCVLVPFTRFAFMPLVAQCAVLFVFSFILLPPRACPFTSPHSVFSVYVSSTNSVSTGRSAFVPRKRLPEHAGIHVDNIVCSSMSYCLHLVLQRHIIMRYRTVSSLFTSPVRYCRFTRVCIHSS